MAWRGGHAISTHAWSWLVRARFRSVWYSAWRLFKDLSSTLSYSCMRLNFLLNSYVSRVLPAIFTSDTREKIIRELLVSEVTSRTTGTRDLPGQGRF